jgi:hypothetical protein
MGLEENGPQQDAGKAFQPKAVDRRQFLDQLFLDVLSRGLASSAQLLPKTHNRSTSAGPTRRSSRHAAAKSVVPVAHCTTHRLI